MLTIIRTVIIMFSSNKHHRSHNKHNEECEVLQKLSNCEHQSEQILLKNGTNKPADLGLPRSSICKRHSICEAQ